MRRIDAIMSRKESSFSGCTTSNARGMAQGGGWRIGSAVYRYKLKSTCSLPVPVLYLELRAGFQVYRRGTCTCAWYLYQAYQVPVRWVPGMWLQYVLPTALSLHVCRDRLTTEGGSWSSTSTSVLCTLLTFLGFGFYMSEEKIINATFCDSLTSSFDVTAFYK